MLSSVFERRDPIRLCMPLRNFMYLLEEKGIDGGTPGARGIVAQAHSSAEECDDAKASGDRGGSWDYPVGRSSDSFNRRRAAPLVCAAAATARDTRGTTSLSKMLGMM